jgi:hypothetical protein
MTDTDLSDARLQVEFEEWAVDYVKGMDSRGRYSSTYTQIAWKAWQASAEAAARRVASRPQQGEDNEGLREDIALICMRWNADADGEWPEDKVIEMLSCRDAAHDGDCTKRPYTCLRCECDRVYKQTDEILTVMRRVASRPQQEEDHAGLVKEIREHLGHQWSDRTFVQSEKVRDIMRRAASALSCAGNSQLDDFRRWLLDRQLPQHAGTDYTHWLNPKEVLEKFDAALSGAGGKEGWQLVPIKPTKEMLEAGADATELPGYIWRDMLAAAPHPEQKRP